jgi:imidazolonepropionase
MTILLSNIGQLATCPPGASQGQAGLINDAAVFIKNGRVAWCGRETDLPALSHDIDRMDCRGRLVIPGLVDCHTHLAFGGWRGDEFALRIAGASYQEIAAAGGHQHHQVNP